MVDEGVPLIADDIVIEVNRKTLSNPRTFVGIEIEVPICQLVGGETTGIAIVEELWMKLGSQRHNIPNQIQVEMNLLLFIWEMQKKEIVCIWQV